MIASRRFKTSDYVKMLGEVRDQCPDLQQAIFLDDEGKPGDWAALLADGESVSADALKTRMASLSPNEPINIQYTSGTTGAPKGATLSHRNILNNALFDGHSMKLSEQDRFCVPVPFYHCAGMVCGNLMATIFGATIVVPAAAFDPGQTLKSIAAERCTGIMAVPTMFIAMLGHPDFAKTDKSSLRTGTIGYWNDKARTEDAIDSEGWMHTGDLGTMDELGYVNIVGRIKDMIIRGGENVYPTEIEGFLYTHPDIQDVQVIGVPDEKFGEEVMACVVMKQGAQPITLEAIKAFCKDKLAHYKVPRYVDVVTEYPMTVTGKIRKVEMRAQAVKKFGLEKAASVQTA